MDAVGLTPGMAPAEVPLALSNRLGLAQGGVMTVLMVVALFFIRHYDLSRARHAEVRRALEEINRSGRSGPRPRAAPRR